MTGARALEGLEGPDSGVGSAAVDDAAAAMEVKLLEDETAGDGGRTIELFLPTVDLTFETESFSAVATSVVADGTCVLVLAVWWPDDEEAGSFVVDKFGSEGRLLSIKAPLLDARAGLSCGC